MQANRDERSGGRTAEGRHTSQTLIIAIGILILVAGAYLLMPGKEDPPPPEIAQPVPQRDAPPAMPEPPAIDPDAMIAAAPDVPEPVADEPIVVDQPQAEDVPEAPAPPTPEEIDQRFREAVAEAGINARPELGTALSAPYLLDRGISSADQVARGLVPVRTLNLPRPRGAFAVQREGMNYSVDPAGYERYNGLTAAITALPSESIARLFHAYRDELESAYASLGYPAEAMDNTLIAALDQIIAAPIVETPPQLVSKGAVWGYADSELESASDLRKQLLRAGPDNTRALQRWAADLRRKLLNP